MKSSNTVSRWQQLCLGYLCLLSPVIRILPRAIAQRAGPYAWCSVLLCLIPLALVYLLLIRFMKNALPNEGLGELFIRALGRVPGKIMIGLFTLWLAFYTSFTLRTVTERYVSSAYMDSSFGIFAVVLAFMAFIAALGRFRPLTRTAEVFFPLVVIILAAVFLLAFQDINPNFLPPFTLSETKNVLSGMPFACEVLGISVYFGFLEGAVGEKEKRTRTMFIFLILIVVTVLLLCLTTIGVFGAGLISRANYPFFAMISNLSLFNMIDRLEAFVLAVWVIMDFIVVATIMFIVNSNLRLIFGYAPRSAEGKHFRELRDGRWLIWCSAAAITAGALVIPRETFGLATLANSFVPTTHLVFIFGLLPLIVFIGIARKRV